MNFQELKLSVLVNMTWGNIPTCIVMLVSQGRDDVIAVHDCQGHFQTSAIMPVVITQCVYVSVIKRQNVPYPVLASSPFSMLVHFSAPC